MTHVHCLRCDKVTPHLHRHDAMHGIPNTHAPGTERYECFACGNVIFADEGAPMGLTFVLDRKVAA